MKLKSYAKINVSLGILGCRPDGYHNILSLMQNINLYDDVEIEKCSKKATKYNFSYCSICNTDVYLCMDDRTIPTDKSNLIIKATEVIFSEFEKKKIKHNIKELWISVKKKLPVAAGIAGGSGNAAITMLGINALAGNPLSLEELMKIGLEVGADVPFSIFMNVKKNETILRGLAGMENASVAAEVTGIGENVESIAPIHRFVILINPGIAVSTAEVYREIDKYEKENLTNAETVNLFSNQLEKYTLEQYQEVAILKEKMQTFLNAECVLMSGSGPTMVAYYKEETDAKNDFEQMLRSDWILEKYRFWLTETGC